MESIGQIDERQLAFESCKTLILDPERFTLMRLDGKSFTRLSKMLCPPFDPAFSDSMIFTARVLVKEFIPMIAYVSSDEITLIFDKGLETFGGRTDKLLSVLSGKASTAFSINLSKTYPDVVERLYPSFDARIWQVQEDVEWMENLMLRQHGSVKNSVSMLAYHHLSKKSLNGVGHKERRQRLLDMGIDWSECEPHDKHGTYIYRKKILVSASESTAPSQHAPTEDFYRTVIEEESIHLANFTHYPKEKFLQMVSK